MAIGPGKYDDLCTHVREETRAHTALVIVMGGKRGTGFSMQSEGPITPTMIAKLLRDVAHSLETGEVPQ